jgi:hypothetical protein
MRKALLWLGFLLCGAGVAAVVASVVMSYAGISASYNLGDPTKFEFILVPLWQIGVAVGLVGGVCLLASRRVKRVA